MSTQTATPAITWSTQYSVGISTIDSQHQKLVGLLNDLHAAMMQGKGKAIIGKILDGLAEYTVSHFAHEERLMQLYRYPEFAQHKAIHDKLIAQVKKLQEDLRGEKATISLDVMSFLQRWLVDHIQGVDKKYTAHMQAAGVK
jgi:hemerythrin-like metal-binding protein